LLRIQKIRWAYHRDQSAQAGVIGTLSWVVLGIGFASPSTGALLGFALLGGCSFMIDAFLELLGHLSELGRSCRSLSVLLGWIFLLTCFDWHLVSFMTLFVGRKSLERKHSVSHTYMVFFFLVTSKVIFPCTCPSWLWDLPFREYDQSPIVVLSVEERLNMTGMFPWKNHFFVTCLSSII
jgi:hypothetical protein